jgi:hypothetical protein
VVVAATVAVTTTITPSPDVNVIGDIYPAVGPVPSRTGGQSLDAAAASNI